MSMSESRFGFFKRGVTTACLKTPHTGPDSRESLTTRLMRGPRLSMQAFRSRKDRDCGVAHELVGDIVDLVAGSAVTDLGSEVLTLGGQMEGVDLDPLLDPDVPVH